MKGWLRHLLPRLLVWGYRRSRSSNLCTQRCRRRKLQILCTDPQNHLTSGSCGIRQSDHWTDVHLLWFQTWHHWQAWFGHSQESRQSIKTWLQPHHQRRCFCWTWQYNCLTCSSWTWPWSDPWRRSWEPGLGSTSSSWPDCLSRMEGHLKQFIELHYTLNSITNYVQLPTIFLNTPVWHLRNHGNSIKINQRLSFNYVPSSSKAYRNTIYFLAADKWSGHKQCAKLCFNKVKFY